MREILTLQIGQCGNKIGDSFWAVISNEHGILPDGAYHGDSDIQLEKVKVYFNETKDGSKFSPRAILVDLDLGTLDAQRAGPYAQLFNPNNFVYGSDSAQNNWARGFHTEGTEILEQVLDVVRKEAEACESLQGFQMIHSLGGGTGSGVGSLLMLKIREEFSGKIMQSFPVFPSSKVSDTVVEPYNALLTMNYLIEHCDMSHVFDNEALYDILFKVFKQNTPEYRDLNHLAAQTMCGLTANLRFPSQLNSDLSKFAQNLVPFPRLHFLLTGFMPLQPIGACATYWPTIPDMFSEILDPLVQLASVDPKHGKYMTASAMYSSRGSNSEFDQFMESFRERRAQYFSQWIPDNIQSSRLSVGQKGLKYSLTFTGNSTAIQEVFERIRETITPMIRRKAFFKWYLGEGMDEQEFYDAESNLNELISEYQQMDGHESEY